VVKIKTICVICVTLLIFSGCNQEEDNDGKGLVLTAKAASLVKVNNQFGFELYRQISEYEKSADNLMVSPLSVGLALAMTYNGAETTTRTAMETALLLKGFTREEINISYQSLLEGLVSLDTKVLLEIANSIYYRKGFQVENDFVTLNQKYYEAEISALDFSSPAAVDVINGWVNTKTKGKIPEILEEITPNQVMFLLNAIYFKGIWSKEFNPKSTVIQSFFRKDGSSVSVPTMMRLDTLDYGSNELFSAIRMPYGYGDYNMFVFLPHEGKTPDNLVSQLNQDNWSKWMKQFKETQNVEIRMPRFKFAYEIKLNDVLTEMGMGIAFTGAADFTGINKAGGLNIDYVKHKTFVEVNEEGTEAAAVTIVAIEKNLAGPEKVYFNVNRPFLFAVTEKSSGAILFLGTVRDPSLNR
jgi:serine protease inhibitor